VISKNGIRFWLAIVSGRTAASHREVGGNVRHALVLAMIFNR
jgi:hypothetical protein